MELLFANETTRKLIKPLQPAFDRFAESLVIPSLSDVGKWQVRRAIRRKAEFSMPAFRRFQRWYDQTEWPEMPTLPTSVKKTIRTKVSPVMIRLLLLSLVASNGNGARTWPSPVVTQMVYDLPQDGTSEILIGFLREASQLNVPLILVDSQVLKCFIKPCKTLAPLQNIQLLIQSQSDNCIHNTVCTMGCVWEHPPDRLETIKFGIYGSDYPYIICIYVNNFDVSRFFHFA